MDLNLRDIRAFVTVAHAGNFTRAAARLHLSQPALTVQIRRLEETVGARLFDRNSRSVALTQTGRELLPILTRSLSDMEQALRDARALGDGSSGTVRLACLPTFAASALPELIQAFRKRVPQARFQVRDVVASAVNALVRNEEVDIGLTGGHSVDATLDILQTGEDRLVIVCPKTHPLARKRTVTVDDFASLPLVLTAPGTSVRAVVDAALSNARCTPNIACEPMYMMTAVAMVRGGLGISVLPESAREVHAERGLVMRPIDDPAFVRPIALVKKRGRTLPRVTEDFVHMVALGGKVRV
ncbi:LysR family transcriptional regulator [Paraburkholderia sp. CNPSo 3272]|uniref:LysR family transcriptional regulator n=1 Tax=Paraburkholderia sp. CNPSo 3272 TaxID=2940931 RepID=UPI0020B63D70|nr:LysR family transcriptional regulator [Paraburkholderia sp. CNPSo 3272]MCP3727944.1 LysR family transcriptional regulator [Paraburkholderia sp. CNPSo 3272]